MKAIIVTIIDHGQEPADWDGIADGPWLRWSWTADNGTQSPYRLLTASEALANAQITFQHQDIEVADNHNTLGQPR